MIKILATFTLLCASFSAQVSNSFATPIDDEHQSLDGAAVSTINPVLQWNRRLLEIVRTPGAQPATNHPTRSFALMHSAIYDAVNAIERTNEPYLVRLNGVPRHTSEEAAAAAAAHEVLIALYPAFKSALDAELQQSLTQIPAGKDKDAAIHTLVSCHAVRLGSGESVSPRSSPGVDQQYIQ